MLIFFSYATIYTMFPVFSLVLDKDVSPIIALTYPELYKELTKVNIEPKIDNYSKINFIFLNFKTKGKIAFV